MRCGDREGWVGVHASVVFYAHCQCCVDEIGRDVYGLLGVDGDILVVFGVVCCAGGDAQCVLRVVCYVGHFEESS